MFEASVYTRRRVCLMQAVRHGVLIIPGNNLIGMNYKENTYPFRQDASFRYLTGLCIPGACLILDCDAQEVFLSLSASSMHEEIWTGPQTPSEDLAMQAGISTVLSVNKAQDLCKNARKNARKLHILPTYQAEQQKFLAYLLDTGFEFVPSFISPVCIEALIALRACKGGEEIVEIRHAIASSCELYQQLSTWCAPGVSEQSLYARTVCFMQECASHEAFPTILTRRGEILHNHGHGQILAEQDLLLVDSGMVSPEGYASDITRTLPVSGKLTSRQHVVYTLVRQAQQAVFAMLAPGIAFVDCHFCAARVLIAGLRDLGLMRGDPEEALQAGAHALFFPHGLGHMLGLDVHDMEALGEDLVGYSPAYTRSAQFGLSGLRLARPVQENWTLTVEPGLYFIPGVYALWRSRKLHEAFINYAALENWLDFGGIRLEDDVLITASGCEVLSAGIPFVE